MAIAIDEPACGQARASSALKECGTEYCGARDRHEHERYFAVQDIDHTPAKARRPGPRIG
ncbi:hypothetical protein GCM10011320_19480 [Neoroseomonas lacus]|uniref:Transposase n=1 Tax=Neoroseomonas lacus TaxID=287609 RepID=A0A917NMT5_9PROT|nr:hypothetical protein GCM10011320_19480 [Neoroseomonas lacus]